MLHVHVIADMGPTICLATHQPCIAIIRRTCALLRLLRCSWLMAIMSEKRLRIRWSISSTRDTWQAMIDGHQTKPAFHTNCGRKVMKLTRKKHLNTVQF